MTAFYASKAVPEEVFGTGDLLRMFYETVAETATGAWELNLGLTAMWDPTVNQHSWVMPDGFNVKVKVIGKVYDDIRFNGVPYVVARREQMPQPEGRSLGANTAHSCDGFVVREMVARCGFDPAKVGHLMNAMWRNNLSLNRPQDKMVRKLWKLYELSGFLSSRILNYLDSDNSGLVDPRVILEHIRSLPKVPFDVLTVHDRFTAPPNYGNDLRKQYNTILAEIAESNMLSFITSQIRQKPTAVRKKGNIGSLIREANYALS